MDAMKVLKERRSVRQYLNTPVSKEVLEDIVDCGRLAASGRNVQPWHFVICTDSIRKKRLADITEYGKFIADAPACILVFCEETKYEVEDGAAATQNILLAAKAHGLASCWVAGNKKPYAPEIDALFEAPKGIKLFSCIAIGYSSEQPRPSKKSLHQVMHWEKF